MSKSFQVEIVSLEGQVFSGLATRLYVTGSQGGLEVLVNHAPLLTTLLPGPVWLVHPDGKEEGLVILGGFLEVQPKLSIILADSAIRASDIDELAARKAKENIEKKLNGKSEINFAKAHAELAYAVAQLQLLKKLRKQIK